MLNTNFFLLPKSSNHCSTNLSAQPDLCSTPSCYSHFICCHPFSTTYIFSKITNRSFRYASPHLWNQLPVSFRQPCINHSTDDVTLSNLSPTCSHHLHPPTLIQCFIPGLKLTFSTNRFHHGLLAPTWTAFSDYAGTDLLRSTVFSFLVIFLFYFGSCDRLSWFNC